MEKIEKVYEYIEYLPEVYREILEVKALNASINLELDRYYQYMQLFINNAHIDSADLETIKRWESIFEINSPIKENLVNRRNAVKAQILGRPIINVNTLKSMTEAYLGVPVSIELHPEDYTIKITYKGIEKLPDMDPYYASVYKTIPANLLVTIAYAFAVWGEVKKKTWGHLKSKSWKDVLYDF